MRIRARTVGVVIYALVAGIALLALLEAVLRLTGSGDTPAGYDPMAGFSSAVPVFEPFERGDGTSAHRVIPARLPARYESSEGREMLATKPSNGFRVFIVGGSTAAGFPYPPGLGFGGWLERRLAAALPDRHIEVVNAAIPGYGSRRVRLVVEEVVRYEPDLVVVYCGHNEWAERRYYGRYFDMHPLSFRIRETIFSTRLFALLSRLRSAAVMDPAETDPAEKIRRYERRKQGEFLEMFQVAAQRADGRSYETAPDVDKRDRLYVRNLEAIAGAVSRSGSRLALVGLVQNHADWAPGASSHREDLRDADLERFRVLVDRGERAARRSDCEGALAWWSQALALDESHAGLHYGIGECHRSLGEFERAWRHFRRASDLDRVPHGAPTRYDDILRATAMRRGEIFVDAEPRLRREAPDGLLGDTLFVDFVHPNLRGHQILGEAIADALREAEIPEPAARWERVAFAEPTPGAILQDRPELALRERQVRLTLCLMARRPRCVEEVRRAIAVLEADLRQRQGGSVPVRPGSVL